VSTAVPSSPNIPKVSAHAILRETFAAWSRVYDDQPNPLLSLEERFLAELLPEIRGLDVVDIGCGTGRWLARLATRNASSLRGIDASPEMVDRARRKLGASANILVGEATSLPLISHSADVLLTSFVASYVYDLCQFAAEIRRVARGSARIFVSDLHPATASACNWNRAFKLAGAAVEPAACSRSVNGVISCFEALGFETLLLLEPPFGSREMGIFHNAGKIAAFHAAAGRPAIYILQLRAGEGRSRSIGARRDAEPQINLTGARVAFGPEQSACADIRVEAGQVAEVRSPGQSQARAEHVRVLDLDGCLVLPGLINSHDHLEFGLFPNLGSGPYANFEQWAEDIQRAESLVIQRQRRIPKDVRLWWGAIRNLLCGVTTVCHHNPLDPVLLGDGFPVRVLTNFGWAHSVSMDPDLGPKFHATPRNVPFVLHAAEGLDEKSADEIFQLDRMHALDDRTVLVHGLGLTSDGISLLNRRGAALIWCPTSNQFLFGQTRSWESLAPVNNLVMGSDSPLTAAGDLLDDIRYAYAEAGVDAEELYRLVITRPATVFRFGDGRGAIRPGATADLIAVRDTGASPAKTLTQMSSGDVELVVVAGRVQLVSEALFGRLPNKLTSGLQPLEVDGRVFWVRAPLGRLFGQATQVLGCGITLGKKKVRNVCTEWI
jgi:cytosine/adenosine deaminase-related metal-dependent hydrolase/ubiquinone/menaquinone biosynthesis C-methylase UbiE